MYVCMYVCLYVCIFLCMYVSIYVCVSSYMCTYASRASMCVCAREWLSHDVSRCIMGMFVMNASWKVCMYVCIYLCLYLCVYICVYTYSTQVHPRPGKVCVYVLADEWVVTCHVCVVCYTTHSYVLHDIFTQEWVMGSIVYVVVLDSLCGCRRICVIWGGYGQ